MGKPIINLITKKVKIKFDNIEFELPSSIQNKINNYWQEQINKGKKYFRGDVYSYISKEENSKDIIIHTIKTDFAHHLYFYDTKKYIKYTPKIVHISAIVETKDNKIILGIMGRHTAHKGILVYPGGGVDSQDLKGSYFDLDKSITKELKEELGLNSKNNKEIIRMKPKYLVDYKNPGGIGIIYEVKLAIDSKHFLERYNKFIKDLKKKKIKPEFDKLILLPKIKKELNNLLSNQSYSFSKSLVPLLKFMDKISTGVKYG